MQGTLSVEDGVISGPGNLATSYWELADHVSLAREADPSVRAKDVARRSLAEKASVERIDIPGKVFGTRPFIHDLVLPGIAARPRPAAAAARRDPCRRLTKTA